MDSEYDIYLLCESARARRPATCCFRDGQVQCARPGRPVATTPVPEELFESVYGRYLPLQLHRLITFTSCAHGVLSVTRWAAEPRHLLVLLPPIHVQETFGALRVGYVGYAKWFFTSEVHGQKLRHGALKNAL